MKLNTVNISTAQGIQGVQGIQGPLNVTGTQGLIGIQGVQGITGTQGAQGVNSLKAVHNVFPTRSGDVISCALFGILNTQTTGSLALRLTVLPFIPAKTLNYSSFLINVITASAGSLMKIVVYSNLNNKPDVKLYESASLDCSTTGIKTASVSGTFTEGVVYWIGYVMNSASVSCSSINNSQCLNLGITNYSGVTGYYRTLSTFTVPSPFGTTSNVNYGVTLIGITVA